MTALGTFVTGRPDTPRSAYAVLERRATVGISAALLVLAAAGWWASIGQSRDMVGMVQGLAQVGNAMPFDMTVPLFLAMWTSMMVAMMFPTIAPVVLLHRMVMRRRGQGMVATAVFVSGYLLVWVVVGLVPLALLVGLREWAGAPAWLPRVGGGVLAVAGAYQFTRWKATCLNACRSPLTFLATHDFGRGLLGTLRAGMSHGAFCLGCCWALMTVLVVVGLMNLAWMGVISVVFLAEKHWPHGAGLTKVVGTALVLFGFAVLTNPALLEPVTSSVGTGSDQMVPAG